MPEPIEGLETLGCADGSCPFTRHRGGMRTNGGCKCLHDAVRDVQARRDVERLLRWKDAEIARLRALVEAAEEMRAEVEKLRAELDEVAGHRCAYAQGAHGIAGCGRCFDCVKSENVKIRAARLRPETVECIRHELFLQWNYADDADETIDAALADINRCYPPEED